MKDTEAGLCCTASAQQPRLAFDSMPPDAETPGLLPPRLGYRPARRHRTGGARRPRTVPPTRRRVPVRPGGPARARRCL